MGFVTEHMENFPVQARVIWDMEEDPRDSGEVLEGKPVDHRLSDSELLEVHEHIIRHSSYTDDLYRYASVQPQTSECLNHCSQCGHRTVNFGSLS